MDKKLQGKLVLSDEMTQYAAIDRLKGKLIVSCQAEKHEPLYPAACMLAMVESVINGGAEGLRMAGGYHIREARKSTNLPIIGLTKPEKIPPNYKELVYITPCFSDAEGLRASGADIIAIDGTQRNRPAETLEELVDLIHSKLNCPVMADISTFEEGVYANDCNRDWWCLWPIERVNVPQQSNQ